MKRKAMLVISISLICIIIAVSITIVNLLPRGPYADGRYEEDFLDYMGVIFEDKTDLEDFHFHCEDPYACDEDGGQYYAADFFFANGTNIIAAAPGCVEYIDHIVGEGYIINIRIRFNWTIIFTYCFEPFTNQSEDNAHQASLLEVKVGDWVQKGDLIGKFLKISAYAHVHWDMRIPCLGGEMIDPADYLDDEGYNKMSEMVDYLNIYGIYFSNDRGGCYF